VGYLLAYVALYRQWRPQDFEQLVGQEHISTTLQNAIAANRIAHAYLFSGPRGTGKTSTAKIMAKALNCIQGPTIHPCNSCDSCMRIADGSSLDVLEIDAASNRGIDEIRELREKVKFSPVDGRYKVYIIDEVHMLTTEAFNALLKTLEEPPGHAIFILATTEPQKIPATILSRCQRYDFRRIDSKDITGRLNKVLQEMSIQADPQALDIIARAAEGGLRDALSILDQCIAFGGEKITADHVRSILGLAGDEWLINIIGAVLRRDVPVALEYIQQLITMGKDARQVILELIVRFRNYLVEPFTPSPQNALSDVSVEEYMEIIQILSDAAQEAKWAPHPRIVLEVAIIKICRRNIIADITGLVARIEKLEAMLAEKPLSAPDRPIKAQPKKVGTSGEAPVTTNPPPLILTPAVDEQKRITQTPPQTVAAHNLGELWDRILNELLKNNKRAIHTCLSEGQLLTVNPDQVVVGFQLPIYKERIEKEDYRGFLEKLIAHITGESRQIKCCIINEIAEKEETPLREKIETNKDNPIVQNAVAMFGEEAVTIVKK
jgi:DNA polymerase-3 subunit gamma/tau